MCMYIYTHTHKYTHTHIHKCVRACVRVQDQSHSYILHLYIAHYIYIYMLTLHIIQLTPKKLSAELQNCPRVTWAPDIPRRQRRQRVASRPTVASKEKTRPPPVSGGSSPWVFVVFFVVFWVILHNIQLTAQQQSAEPRNSAGAEALAAARRPKGFFCVFRFGAGNSATRSIPRSTFGLFVCVRQGSISHIYTLHLIYIFLFRRFGAGDSATRSIPCATFGLWGNPS